MLLVSLLAFISTAKKPTKPVCCEPPSAEGAGKVHGQCNTTLIVTCYRNTHATCNKDNNLICGEGQTGKCEDDSRRFTLAICEKDEPVGQCCRDKVPRDPVAFGECSTHVKPKCGESIAPCKNGVVQCEEGSTPTCSKGYPFALCQHHPPR